MADREFIVRLVMKVDAAVPEAAVTEFVDLLVANGLREWVYRVESVEDGEILGYFDGFGQPVDIHATTAEASTEPPAEDSDEALEKLAESLNEQQE